MLYYQNFIDQLNRLGKTKTPFLFIIDFEIKKPLVFPLSELPDHIKYDIPKFSNCKPASPLLKKQLKIKKKPVNYNTYQELFNIVNKHLSYGDLYLLNLTKPTELFSNLSMQEIFDHSQASYRLKYKDEFICFSPEIFVRIADGTIASYPMKGTIKASVDNAEEKIIKSQKEFAEHNTIVDLIRNDLSMVAKKVRVNRFRYIDKVKTHEGDLLQVSSEISGNLPTDYADYIGDILFKLLPAGSISGAPKAKTLEIIRETEKCDRGYYTGIFGVFDGRMLESAVMIRYIEKLNNKLIYRSGGGITAMSDCKTEYQELIDKVYVPVI
ncbi:MAG: aminodeoxychorismate synthase component I [Bacteroidetes bacterium]|nr:aminodeoxychorismate synthase component I [Bacteroidota bacterium]